VTEIAVMQHTGCALANRSDDDIRSALPSGYAARAGGLEFLAMPDPDKSLMEDVEAVRSCELLPADIRVEGWRYSVETGEIRRVVT
jgi:carbonic anhydrase